MIALGLIGCGTGALIVAIIEYRQLALGSEALRTAVGNKSEVMG